MLNFRLSRLVEYAVGTKHKFNPMPCEMEDQHRNNQQHGKLGFCAGCWSDARHQARPKAGELLILMSSAQTYNRVERGTQKLRWVKKQFPQVNPSKD